jgi:hypothetical protein
MVFAAVLAPAAFACSCITPPPKDAFKSARAVFLGKVLSYDGAVATFEVLRNFKGAPGETFQALTSSTACGYGQRFDFAKEHLIYAQDFGSGIEIDLCGRSAAVHDAGCDLAYLKSRAAWWRSPVSSLRLLSWSRVYWRACP